jgi:hypothetical protein
VHFSLIGAPRELFLTPRWTSHFAISLDPFLPHHPVLASVALAAEREQPARIDKLGAALRDRIAMVNLERGERPAPLAAPGCAGTDVFTQSSPGGAVRSLVLAAAALADGGMRAAGLRTDRGRPHETPPTLVDSHHPRPGSEVASKERLYLLLLLLQLLLCVQEAQHVM